MLSATSLATDEARASLHPLRTLVSPYTGIVNRVSAEGGHQDEPFAPRFVAGLHAWFRLNRSGDMRLAGLRAAEDPAVVNAPTRAGGSALTAGSAWKSTVGEAAERYAATCIAPERLVYGSADELGPDAIDPNELAFFSANQYSNDAFPYRRPERTTRVRWIDALRLPDLEPMYIPAQLAYLSHALLALQPSEHPIAHTTSNGLACGESVPAAALSALFEVLERDALLATWYYRRSRPLLRWDGERRFEDVERRLLAQTHLQYAAVDVSSVHDVPAVIAVVRGEIRGQQVLTCGAAAGRRIDDVWLKSLLEAFHVRVWLKRCSEKTFRREFAPDGSDVRSFEDHILYYAHPVRAAAADFLTASRKRSHVADIPQLSDDDPESVLHSLTTKLRARGVDTYLVDLTPSDLREAGLAVVRIVAPRLFQLNAAHEARSLGVRRPLDARAGSADDLNPWPHPLA